MSAMTTTWARTVGHARNMRSTAFVVAGFLVACAARLFMALQGAEGASSGVVPLWTAAVVPVLPVLSALLAMGVWSDEHATGRVEMLLSSPVRERDLVLGKFVGVWTVSFASLLVFFVPSYILLRLYAPHALAGVGFLTFLPALVALGLQGVLWCAVSVAVSAMLRSAAMAAATSAVLLVVLPRVAWYALVRGLPILSAGLGDMPIDAHAVDIASGVVSSCTVLSYLTLSALALLVASKRIALLRFCGSGGLRTKVSTGFVILLSVVLAVLSVSLFHRFDATLDLPVGRSEIAFSSRTRNILSEARGVITVTAFVSRSDPRFRAVAHFLRSLGREAVAQSGVRLDIRFTDPRWDLGDAERLVRSGVTEPSVVFSNARRSVALPIRDRVGERAAAGAILQLTLSPQRRQVYWTRGHGEAAFGSYEASGMSDIARELSRDGYGNAAIDLGADAQVPSDCALIVVAGARDDFSRAEAARIDAYLKQGGRLLVLLDSAESGGLLSLLPTWGLMAADRLPIARERTLTGSDVVVSSFADHPVSAPLAGSQIVLDRPLALQPSAAADQGGGADRIVFSALARSGGGVVAAIAERGSKAGEDTAIRPTRVIAIGDSGFVSNAHLAERANANRDFFLNCVAYLSGSHAIVSGGPDGDVFVSGMSVEDRVWFGVWLGGVLPLAVLAVLVAVASRRRRSK